MYIGRIGIGRKGGDLLDRLNKAKSMHGEGVNARAIKYATGCEKLMDDHWRMEIPDKVVIPMACNPYLNRCYSMILQPYVMAVKDNSNITFKEYLETIDPLKREIYESFTDEEKEEVSILAENLDTGLTLREPVDITVPLFDIVPEMQEYYEKEMKVWTIRLAYLDGGSLGYTDPKHQKILIHNGLSIIAMKATIVHEVQHVIHEIEGFEKGANEYLSKLMLATSDIVLDCTGGMIGVNGEVNVHNFVQEAFFSKYRNDKDRSMSDNIRLDVRFCLRMLAFNFDFGYIAKAIIEANEYYARISDMSHNPDKSNNPVFDAYQCVLGETEARNTSYRDETDSTYKSVHLFNDTIDVDEDMVYVRKSIWQLFRIDKGVFDTRNERNKVLYESNLTAETLSNFIRINNIDTKINEKLFEELYSLGVSKERKVNNDEGTIKVSPLSI